MEADLYLNLKKEQESKKSPQKPSQTQMKLQMRKEIFSTGEEIRLKNLHNQMHYNHKNQKEDHEQIEMIKNQFRSTEDIYLVKREQKKKRTPSNGGIQF